MWAAPGESDDHTGFVMLRGRFDTARLEAKAREHKNVQIEDFHGARLLRLVHDPSDTPSESAPPRDGQLHHRRTAVLAFVEPGLLMFGEEAPVKRALSRSAETVHGGHEHVLRQTLITLRAGTAMTEHENPGEATVLVLRGRVRLRSGADSWEGIAGDLLIVPPARHSLEAVEDAAALLTVAKRP